MHAGLLCRPKASKPFISCSPRGIPPQAAAKKQAKANGSPLAALKPGGSQLSKKPGVYSETTACVEKVHHGLLFERVIAPAHLLREAKESGGLDSVLSLVQAGVTYACVSVHTA